MVLRHNICWSEPANLEYLNKMKRFACLAATLLAVLSCAREEFRDGDGRGASDVCAAKIVNELPSGEEVTSVLVYLENTTEENLAELREGCGAVSASRVFQNEPGKEEAEESFGLNNWYRFDFEKGDDIRAKAQVLASAGTVRTVEYNVRVKRCNVGKPKGLVAGDGNGIALMSIPDARFNDPGLEHQWHYSNPGSSYAAEAYAGADINVKQAWSLSAGNPEIVVAVIDEAVQYNHPDLEANMWNNPNADTRRGTYFNDRHGWNFVKNSASLNWTNLGNVGHGTHVAGTVAAVNNNSTGVCGVAGGSGHSDGVKIMSCQIFDGFSGGTADVVANAFKYAADNGACIAQCSFGVSSGTYKNDNAYYSANRVEVDAIRYFIRTAKCPAMDGGIVICAAGNESGAISGYPAALKECVSVTSLAIDGLPSYFTNYGPGSNIAAPGGEWCTGGKDKDEYQIYSTLPTDRLCDFDEETEEPTEEYLPTDYGWMQGTSMSCPHVSGVAAIGLAYAMKMGYHFTSEEFKSLLLTSVYGIDDHIGRAGKKTILVYNGYKYQSQTMQLSGYRRAMGTGAIDAWRLLMNMDGVPSVLAIVGESQRIDISDWFGSGSDSLTYISAEVLDDGSEALGLTEAPSIKYGRLVINPTRPGCARIRIKAIAGGTSLSGSSYAGGTEVTRVVSVIARPDVSPEGGWL